MKRGFSILLALGSLVCSLNIYAHHSFAAQYDINQPITLVGKVTSVEWTNPHTRFYIDVTDEDGNVTNWNIELGSPNVLKRMGWSRNDLQIGDEVTVEGSKARSGADMANAEAIILKDGKRVYSRNPADLR